MRSAARSGKISLSIVTCDGRLVPFHVRKRNVKSSQSVQQHLQAINRPVHVGSRVHEMVVSSEVHGRPSCTPSIGSRQSDHEAVINTVEMAAQISRSSFKYSGKRREGKVNVITIDQTCT